MIRKSLWSYQPRTSEWTFTNLFIWRSHFGLQWSNAEEWLVFLCTPKEGNPYLLQPVGIQPRRDIALKVLRWLRDEKGIFEPVLERADKRLVAELEGDPAFEVQPVRAHFDYLYRSQDLIELKGGKYHAKRNHINKLRSQADFSFHPLTKEYLTQCFDLQERWCEWKRCEEDMNLLGEWDAVGEALANYEALEVRGGVIVIDGKVEAFTFGELLNTETAVVHIEKASPELPALYSLINQQFCQEYWSDITFINREQDLGEEGLRRAKLSYHPVELVEKYQVRLVH